MKITTITILNSGADKSTFTGIFFGGVVTVLVVVFHSSCNAVSHSDHVCFEKYEERQKNTLNEIEERGCEHNTETTLTEAH